MADLEDSRSLESSGVVADHFLDPGSQGKLSLLISVSGGKIEAPVQKGNPDGTHILIPAFFATVCGR